MQFPHILAAFFYLQPSLIINFVPVQIMALFFSLWYYKKISIFKAFFYSFAATIATTILIFLIGFIVVPFLYVRFFQLLEISLNVSLFLLFISTLLYWLFISFFLHYLLKQKTIKLTALSSAIAGFSVLVLYYLLWRK